MKLKLSVKDYLLAEEEIKKAVGLKPRLLRSPKGVTSLWFLKGIQNLGLRFVGWDLAVADWKTTIKSEKIIKKIKKGIKPGVVVLLHDGLDNQIGTQVELVKALPKIIDQLEEEGYTFVTVDKILQVDPYFKK